MEKARTVLLVDDDDVFRERLASALRRRGFEVQTAETPQKAQRLASEHQVHWALVDLRMPEGSGLEVLESLKRIDPTTIVVLLTGYGSIVTAVEAIRLGAHDYLSKPVNADEIIATFQKHVLTGESPTATEPQQEESHVPSLARVEWEHIQRVLKDTDGNISEAARRLGMHRRSLQRKLDKFPPNK